MATFPCISCELIPPLFSPHFPQFLEQRVLADLPAVHPAGDQQAGSDVLQGDQVEPVHLQQRLRQVLLRTAQSHREERLPQVRVLMCVALLIFAF